MKVFRCSKCGNIVMMLNEGGGTLTCCGEAMQELDANTTDAALEKHVPDVSIDGDKAIVQVGSVAHPMLEEHFIQWIYMETEDGAGQIQYLKPGAEPKAEFPLNGKKPSAVYEYCNLHGFWKKEL